MSSDPRVELVHELNKRLLAAVADFTEERLEGAEPARTRDVLSTAAVRFATQVLAVVASASSRDPASARRIKWEGHTDAEIEAVMMTADRLRERFLRAMEADDP